MRRAGWQGCPVGTSRPTSSRASTKSASCSRDASKLQVGPNALSVHVAPPRNAELWGNCATAAVEAARPKDLGHRPIQSRGSDWDGAQILLNQ